MTDRTVAWLIERRFPASGLDGPQHRWYAENSLGFHWWTPDAKTAMKFSTRTGAEAFTSYQMIYGDPDISITEHVFMEDRTHLKGRGKGDAIMNVGNLLDGLCHPSAEAMSDTTRLTAFVHAGRSAVGAISALVGALEYARSELADRGGATMSFPKIDAALALARSNAA